MKFPKLSFLNCHPIGVCFSFIHHNYQSSYLYPSVCYGSHSHHHPFLFFRISITLYNNYTLSNLDIRRDVIAYLRRVTIKLACSIWNRGKNQNASKFIKWLEMSKVTGQYIILVSTCRPIAKCIPCTSMPSLGSKLGFAGCQRWVDFLFIPLPSASSSKFSCIVSMSDLPVFFFFFLIAAISSGVGIVDALRRDRIALSTSR